MGISRPMERTFSKQQTYSLTEQAYCLLERSALQLFFVWKEYPPRNTRKGNCKASQVYLELTFMPPTLHKVLPKFASLWPPVCLPSKDKVQAPKPVIYLSQ